VPTPKGDLGYLQNVRTPPSGSRSPRLRVSLGTLSTTTWSAHCAELFRAGRGEEFQSDEEVPGVGWRDLVAQPCVCEGRRAASVLA